jgi:hypothetical protein
MGYISENMELDAILTKRGRELLTNNPGAFKITKFSLADDEVDYRLWNTNHSLGSDYYGEVIEHTPILEPLPGEEQQAKFRLVTLPKDTINIPRLVLGASTVELKANQEYIIMPQSNPNIYNLTKGYTITVWDFDFGLMVFTDEFLPGGTNENSTQVALSGVSILGSKPYDGPSTMTSIGKTFKLIAGSMNDSLDHIYTVSVVGNETGNRETMQVTVKGKYAAPPRA